MNVFLQLLISFSSIGLFAFGGGYAVLSLLQHEVVRREWINAERFADMIAISQSTPGTIAINLATFVGYDAAGIFGALLASLAVLLPGVVLMILFARFFLHFYEGAVVQALFRGLRPAALGLIAGAAWSIGRIAMVTPPAVVIGCVCCLVIAKWRIHPVFFVVGSAIAGILFL